MKTIDHHSDDERRELTKQFLTEVYYEFRKVGLKWAKLSQQTNFFPKGYFGQNLISIVTGIVGTGTAARGDDLKDGSEVKTCARIDQLNSCKDCKARLASYITTCPNCKGNRIKRMVDSHWICAIDATNYKKYYEETPHIYFLLIDDKDLDDEFIARFTIWDIVPKENKKWQESYVYDYYHNNYLIKIEQKRKPAPMNVHPRSPKFKNIDPIEIFESTISTTGIVNILQFPSSQK